MGKRRSPDRFIEGIRARQRNIVFPDTVRNARSVDAFLWKGSPNPTLVQRIGAWMFGLSFTGVGAALCFLGIKGRPDEDQSSLGPWAAMLIGIFFVLVGARVFRNGFPRPEKRE